MGSKKNLLSGRLDKEKGVWKMEGDYFSPRNTTSFRLVSSILLQINGKGWYLFEYQAFASVLEDYLYGNPLHFF